MTSNLLVTEPRIQYLGIHHLGRPHSLRKLRVQLKVNNIIELRNKKLIVGWYNLKETNIYCIIDPLHLSSLVFANTSSVNISLDDIEFTYDYGLHLTKEKYGQYFLFLKEDLFTKFIHEFYLSTELTFDVFDWTKFLIDYYTRISKSEPFHTFSISQSFELSPESAKLIEADILECIHWNGTKFDRGFKGSKSLVVTKDLSNYLCFNHSVDISINRLCADEKLFEAVRKLCDHEMSNFVSIKDNILTVRTKYSVFEELVGNFLKNCRLNAATPTEIDLFIRSKLPSARDKFSSWKTSRFKQRLILGNSNDESYYFDSEDKSVNDLIFQYRSYRDFIQNNLFVGQNIYDIYLIQKSVDENVEVSKLYNSINSVAKLEGYHFVNGCVLEEEKDDWIRGYIGKKILKVLVGENSIVIFNKEELAKYRLAKHYAFRYLKENFPVHEEGDNLIIEVKFKFVDDIEFEGWVISSFDYAAGLFPIIFQYEILSVDRNFFFLANDSYYWITFRRNSVRLNMSKLFKP
jgi:hypothetical protein